MSRKKKIPSMDEVDEILNIDKITVKDLEWLEKKTFSAPQWVEFKTACRIENKIREDVFFVSNYRASKLLSANGFTLEKNEIFNASILIGGSRVGAIDCGDSPHRNTKGKGLPFFGQNISTKTHKHIWTPEGYGYVEPYDTIYDIEELLDVFQREYNLTIKGSFVHPMHRIQPTLI